MILTKRKSKFKTKVEFNPRWGGQEHSEVRHWCEQRFGPSGRKMRWRFGWIDERSTYYFKQEKDASMFVLRWCDTK